MTQREVSLRALAFVQEVLGKEAHYLDSSPTETGWLVRVIVVEKKEKPGSPVKRWHVLYEVHLGASLEPVLHVRRGLWDKGLPQPPKDKEEARERLSSRATAVPPAGGEEGCAAGVPHAEKTESHIPDERRIAEEADESRRAGETHESRPTEASEENRIAEESRTPRDFGRQTSADPPAAWGGPPERPVEASRPDGEERLIEAVDETIEEEAGEASPEDEETRVREAETGRAVGEDTLPEDSEAAQDTPEPQGSAESADAPHAEEAPAGPSRPKAQEKQGPPRVSLRYVREDSVRPGKAEKEG
ncbi:MAG: hypothetical protein AB1645_00685 [Bacillota bacterium]